MSTDLIVKELIIIISHFYNRKSENIHYVFEEGPFDHVKFTLFIIIIIIFWTRRQLLLT